MTQSGPDAAKQESAAGGGKRYRPSKALFFVMLAMIVGALVLFMVIGPLKGGGGSGGSGSSNSTSSPSQH